MVEFAPMVLATPEGWAALFMASAQPQDRTKTAPRLANARWFDRPHGGIDDKKVQ